MIQLFRKLDNSISIISDQDEIVLDIDDVTTEYGTKYYKVNIHPHQKMYLYTIEDNKESLIPFHYRHDIKFEGIRSIKSVNKTITIKGFLQKKIEEIFIQDIHTCRPLNLVIYYERDFLSSKLKIDLIYYETHNFSHRSYGGWDRDFGSTCSLQIKTFSIPFNWMSLDTPKHIAKELFFNNPVVHNDADVYNITPNRYNEILAKIYEYKNRFSLYFDSEPKYTQELNNIESIFKLLNENKTNNPDLCFVLKFKDQDSYSKAFKYMIEQLSIDQYCNIELHKEEFELFGYEIST